MRMRYLRDVVTLRLDVETCIGCGRCVEVCPHRVFIVEEHKSRIVDRDACMECGACAQNCPVDALWVKNGVGCAIGILNSALGLKAACCGEDQACCCGDDKKPVKAKGTYPSSLATPAPQCSGKTGGNRNPLSSPLSSAGKRKSRLTMCVPSARRERETEKLTLKLSHELYRHP